MWPLLLIIMHLIMFVLFFSPPRVCVYCASASLCMSASVPATVPVSAVCVGPRLVLVVFSDCFPPYSLRQGLPKPDISNISNLASQLAPLISVSALRSEMTGGPLPHLLFKSVVGFKLLTLKRQELYSSLHYHPAEHHFVLNNGCKFCALPW